MLCSFEFMAVGILKNKNVNANSVYYCYVCWYHGHFQAKC